MCLRINDSSDVFLTAPSTSCVIPINDIRGIGSLVYAKVSIEILSRIRSMIRSRKNIWMKWKNWSLFSIFRVRSSYGVNLQQSIDSFTSTAGVRLGIWSSFNVNTITSNIFTTLTATIIFQCKQNNVSFFQGIYNHVTQMTYMSNNPFFPGHIQPCDGTSQPRHRALSSESLRWAKTNYLETFIQGGYLLFRPKNY